MNNNKTMVLLFVLAAVFFTQAIYAVTIDWVTVGNAGNSNDNTGYGGVSYEYKIGKYEITNDQYIAFLNAVAKTDTNALYNINMGGVFGGITQSGTPGNYTYSLKGGDANWGNKPVNFIMWTNALRFANWIHNGQPTGLQNASTTEDGAYDVTLGVNAVRKTGALVWLPTKNEWYKAAYYSPSGVYYDYAIGTDTPPDNNTPLTQTGNSANYSDGVYAVGAPYYSTDVGAYNLSSSPYGTYDQTGNAWEWCETPAGGNRVLSGGSWDTLGVFYTSANFNHSEGIYNLHNTVGFRLGSDMVFGQNPIPEPMTVSMLAMSLLSFLFFKKRK